jgi:hypothetical protein
MTFLRRRPRAIYRVYSEDEYLAGVDPFADWNAPAAELTEVSLPELTEVSPPELREMAVPELTEMTAHLAGQYSSPAVPAATAGAGISRERRLRRLAGAAALTGAVGTVGVTVGLAGLRSHPDDRQIAVAVVSSPARTVPAIGGGPRVLVSPTRVTLRRNAAHRIGAWNGGAHRDVPHRSPASGRSTRVVRRVPFGLRTAANAVLGTANARISQSAPSAPERQPEQDTYTPVASAPQESTVPVASTAQSTLAETAPEPRAQSEFGFER